MTEDLVSRLQSAIAAIDKADADCPVGQSSRYIEECPKCRGTKRENCGPVICALGDLETTVREILQPPTGDANPPEAERVGGMV